MSAAAERRSLTAYTLYEGLMRAVNAEDPSVAMDIAGSETLTPRLLLGAQEPSKEEEDLWFQERTRCWVSRLQPCYGWNTWHHTCAVVSHLQRQNFEAQAARTQEYRG